MTQTSIAAKAAHSPTPWSLSVFDGRAVMSANGFMCAEARPVSLEDGDEGSLANARRIVACINLLSGHDLSAVAIVPVGVTEGVRDALSRADAVTRAAGVWSPVYRDALAALSAKADAGVQ